MFDIKAYYKKVAEHNGAAPTMSMADQYIRQAETEFILNSLTKIHKKNKRPLTILDAGMGNGYLLTKIRERFPKDELVGIDLSPELFSIAQNRKIDHCVMIEGDLTDKQLLKELPPFQVLITERSIINILQRNKQFLALNNLLSSLSIRGHYIMVESFIDPLRNLNDARNDFLMGPISVPKHNNYLSEKFLNVVMEKLGLIELTQENERNGLSTYFYLARIIHEQMRLWDKSKKYSSLIEFMAQGFPPHIGNYSPILFRLFQKLR